MLIIVNRKVHLCSPEPKKVVQELFCWVDPKLAQKHRDGFRLNLHITWIIYHIFDIIIFYHIKYKTLEN